MKEVGFPGMEKIQVFQDDSELVSLLSFFLKISEGTRIKRTGWVQNGIRDPERIAGNDLKKTRQIKSYLCLFP